MGDKQVPEQDRRRTTLIKSCITLGALLFVSGRARWPSVFDEKMLGFAALAALPWLSEIIRMAKIGGLEVEFLHRQVELQAKELDRQQRIIQDLVVFSMSASIFDHLRALYHRKRHGEEYLYRNNPPFQREMYYLRDNGYIRPVRESFIDFGSHLDGRDLVQELDLTPIGNFYVEERERLESASAH